MAELGITDAGNLTEVRSDEFIEEFCEMWGFKSQLQDLLKTLSTVKNVCLDARSRLDDVSQEARVYIRELVNVLYDADKLFDEFFISAKLKLLDGNKDDTFLDKKVGRFYFGKTDKDWEVSQADRMSNRFKDIKEQLDTILLVLSQHKLYGINVVDYNPICDAEENQQNRDQANMHVSLSTTSSTETIRSKILGSRDYLNWVFVVLNVVVEICQATFSQAKNQGKMRPNIYFILSIITSSICLMMVIFETFREGMGAGIVWRKRGYCCWFRYPGNEGRLFGRFSLYFALISSMIQLIINLLQKLTNKDIVKFDYIPLLLAICYMVAAIISTQENTPSAILMKCKVHGPKVVEGTLTVVDGHESRLFQCPGCQREREEDGMLNRC